jgi:ATP-dependent DNA helicase RecQ
VLFRSYEAKLPDDDAPAIFSLRDETKNGEILEFKRVLQYIDVMKRDMSGSETDNIKHLRGAATRLLRSAPDNYSLHLLKAFALFVVAWRNNAAFQEACTSCEKGLNGYLGAFDPDAPEGVIREYIEPYTQSVLHYLPVDGAEQVKNFLRELPETLTLKYHVDWIRHFNNRFLSDFKPKFSVHAK